MGMKFDYFIWGNHMYHVVFELGNLSAADVWARKTIAAFQESCFASTRNYSAWCIELNASVWMTLSIFVMMDRFSIIADMTTAAGFVASVTYSSACEAVPCADRPIATLLVNLAMTTGMYCGIGLAWALTWVGGLPHGGQGS